MSDNVSTDIHTDRLRVRINHKHTAKDGYVHETTVEVVGPMNDTIDTGRVIKFWLQESDELGRIESARRNGLDGRDVS